MKNVLVVILIGILIGIGYFVCIKGLDAVEKTNRQTMEQNRVIEELGFRLDK